MKEWTHWTGTERRGKVASNGCSGGCIVLRNMATERSGGQLLTELLQHGADDAGRIIAPPRLYVRTRSKLLSPF